MQKNRKACASKPITSTSIHSPTNSILDSETFYETTPTVLLSKENPAKLHSILAEKWKGRTLYHFSAAVMKIADYVELKTFY